MTDQQWQTANTLMALINQGCTNGSHLARSLGKSKTVTYTLINRLITLGLLTKTPATRSTLRLTSSCLVRLAVRRPDGALEAYQPEVPNASRP